MEIFFDFSNLFLGALFLFLSLIFVPEIKTSKKNNKVVKLGIFILIVIGIWQAIYRNDLREQTASEKSKDSTRIINLGESLAQSRADRKTDSINNANFQQALKDSFHIIRDINTNMPRFISNLYDIHVRSAHTVNIGSHN